MKTIYTLLVSALTVHAGWYGLDFSPWYTVFDTTPQGSEIARFDFPPRTLGAHFPAFVIYEQVTPVDLRGATITCKMDLTNVTPETTFVFGGEGRWNKGTMPSHARLYFATVSGYYNEGISTNYWFHNNGTYAVLTNNMGIATLTATINGWGGWTDGKGGSLSNAFWDAASRAIEVGICFGGGNFFDVGCAVSSGNATFRLLSFSVSVPFRAEIDRDTAQVSVSGGFGANRYQIQESDDLALWSVVGTNSVTATPNHFYRVKLVD
jgi:hypothetical protein